MKENRREKKKKTKGKRERVQNDRYINISDWCALFTFFYYYYIFGGRERVETCFALALL